MIDKNAVLENKSRKDADTFHELLYKVGHTERPRCDGPDMRAGSQS
jgi:hypothetical protein